MWSYKLFRIGALVLALGSAAHLLGVMASKGNVSVYDTGFQLQEMLYGRRSNIFGTMRSQGEIIDGLNLAYAIYLLTLSVLGFTLPVRRKTAVVIAVSMTALLVVSLTYWYIVPTTFIAAALLCYAGSAYLEK